MMSNILVLLLPAIFMILRLIISLIVFFVFLGKRKKRMASQMIEEGKRYLVRCEHCHGEYHVRPDDYAASHLKKEIQIDLPGKASDYSYAKRFFVRIVTKSILQKSFGWKR